MGLLSVLFSNPLLFFMLVVPLLYSVILHEVAHGWTAYLFGDKTASYMGRLSLNPLKHLDPVGTIALFLVGFGWAKPVPVNYYNFRYARLGLVFVSLAGVLMNILLAALAVFLLRFQIISENTYFSTILFIAAKINILLGAFNLIPLPPLDGSKIIMGFLPQPARESVARFEPYGFFILFFLLLTGYLNPMISFLQKIILSFINVVVG